MDLNLSSLSRIPIKHQIDNVKFDFYDSESIKRISIKPVTSSLVYDNLGIPVKGSLHDPSMGVSAYDKTCNCEVCGENTENCPGHFAHIDLSVTLYNPFMLNHILKLLNSKCFNCHRLKIHKKDKNYLFMKILLTKLGLLFEADSLQDILYTSLLENTEELNKKVENFLRTFSSSTFPSIIFEEESSVANDSIDMISNQDRHGSFDTNNSTHTNDTNSGTHKKKKKITEEEQDKIEKTRQEIEAFKRSTLLKKNEKLNAIFKQISIRNKQILKEKKEIIYEGNVNSITQMKEIESEFWRIMKMNKCAHCGASCMKIKKFNNVKFFQIPLSQRERHKMKKYGIDPQKDALEEGSAQRIKEKEKIIKKKKKKMQQNEFKSEEEIQKDKKKMKHYSEFDEDDENDSDSDLSLNGEEDKNPESSGLKFLHAIEVKEQIHLLWQRDGDLLSLFYGNLKFRQAQASEKSSVANFGNRMNFEITSSAPGMFFLESLIVPPNRFRPPNATAGDSGSFLHPQTVLYAKIYNMSNEIRELSLRLNDNTQIIDSVPRAQEESKSLAKAIKSQSEIVKNTTAFEDLMIKWIKLQDTVNILFDSQKALSKKDQDSKGIRQILEKKEGLFRMKLMGKRVNFAGRTVISPDPMIGTSEVGIPLIIASKLYIPEPVTVFNKERLQQLIINGPFKYPGANLVLKEDGRTISLANVKEEFRTDVIAQNLQIGQTVFRHMQTGDALLVNRQPTLHKPSIMSHYARVLKGEKTIRLHYANCSTYNADFDGDEMNIHFLQNPIAREEAYLISNTDNQYIVPTSGRPIRGLIQDSVVSAVYLTMKDSFFTKEDYYQIVFASLEVSLSTQKIRKIVTVEPAILKPKILFTGKQVITSILKSLCTSKMVDHIVRDSDPESGVCFDQSTKLGKDIWTISHAQEGTVIFRYNEMLTGVLDKNQIGSTEFGLIHSVYEIYGPEMAGELITVLGKLFIYFLQNIHGFTCGVSDVILKEETNFKRRVDIENLLSNGMESLARFFDLENYKLKYDNYSHRNVYTRKNIDSIAHLKLLPDERKKIEKIIELQNIKIETLFAEEKSPLEDSSIQVKELRDKFHDIILKDDSLEKNIDTVVKSALNVQSANITKNWLEKGLVYGFPKNYFAMMVKSGAKGTVVNHTLVTCMLGQQELEGRRVPRMASGRTLPSFEVFDPNPRAGGYITDRFSTGIRPQEFFFHCMAGREGLIDTAVKTSRSGYMQRCLMKHLEQLMVTYDYTVRDSDGNIIQFLYGEDSIDVINTKYLSNFKFITENLSTYIEKYQGERLAGKIDISSVSKAIKNNDISYDDTLLNKFPACRYLGSVSEKIYEKMTEYLTKDPDKKFKHNEDDKPNFETNNINTNIPLINSFLAKNKKFASRSKFKKVVFLKYLNSLVQPGESVGVLAAQSIGEPSTQMTLNTFHLAGHGGANVTLGIPRLREILMTSEKNIKTPIMILPVFSKDLEEVKKLARKFENYKLIDVVKQIKSKQSIKFVSSNKRITEKSIIHEKYRYYSISIQLEDMANIAEYFEYSPKNVIMILKGQFIPNLAKNIARLFRVSSKKREISMKKVRYRNKGKEDTEDGEGATDEEEDTMTNEIKRRKNSEENEDESSEEPEDEEDGSATKKIKEDEGEEEDEEKENEEEVIDEQGENEGEDVVIENEEEKEEEANEDEDEEIVVNNETAEKETNPEKNIQGAGACNKKKKRDYENEILNLRNYQWEEIYIENMEFIFNYTGKESTNETFFTFELIYPYKQKNILLKNILDSVLRGLNFKSIRGIKKCHILDRNVGKEKEFILQLEGFNFKEITKFYEEVDLNRFGTNDIGGILNIYGIEACRNSIVKEIMTVFDSYSINVDKRHLGLIADYITYQGKYRSFNRKGISYCSSPWLKMTFETTMEFLIDSCKSKEIDKCKSPSARIILGQVPLCGTGSFSIFRDHSK